MSPAAKINFLVIFRLQNRKFRFLMQYQLQIHVPPPNTELKNRENLNPQLLIPFLRTSDHLKLISHVISARLRLEQGPGKAARVRQRKKPKFYVIGAVIAPKSYHPAPESSWKVGKISKCSCHFLMKKVDFLS